MTENALRNTAATALAHLEENVATLAPFQPTQQRIELIRRTIAADCTPDEFEMFLAYCQRTQLDPIARQIYIIVRGQGENRKASIQTSIDGFRTIAQHTGRYDGRVGPMWCGPDGQWTDVWLRDDFPAAAKVGVRIRGVSEPTWAVVTWKEFAQFDGKGKLTFMWATKGPHMLAKCAESQALRIALPAELSGLYTDDEMGQADNPPPRAVTVQQSRPAPPLSDLGKQTASLVEEAKALGIKVPPLKGGEGAESQRNLWLSTRIVYRKLCQSAEDEYGIPGPALPDPCSRAQIVTAIDALRQQLAVAPKRLAADEPLFPNEPSA